MSPSSLTDLYRSRIDHGFQTDESQLEIVQDLESLGQQLCTRTIGKSFLKKVRARIKGDSQRIKGLYIWGDVGRGKTFLMDLFFDWLPIEAKRRVHFHRFMSEVHRQLHELKGKSDPLEIVADRIAAGTRILCFDEFFVSDIGDAMILAGMLQALFERNVTLVATSNIEPKCLYENGLQRSRFLPAIDLLETNTQILEMQGQTDYRLQVLKRRELYRVMETVSDQDIDSDIRTLVEGHCAKGTTIEILSRTIDAIFVSEGIAGFTFESLCETPRSTEDYIELSRLFHTVVLYNIPVLDSSADSAARRFIHLVDEFYDRNVNMIFYAAEPIMTLYQGSQMRKDFERTQSRVLEMQSDKYLSKAHKN